MQPIYLAIFIFVYISKKNTPFRGRNRYKPFLDIYFCPKRKIQRTFGKHNFLILYILLILLLKENSIPVPYSQFSFFSEENYNKN
jgi:hypothetical protein